MWDPGGKKLQQASFYIRVQESVPNPLKKPLLGSLQANCVCSVIVRKDADGMRKLRNTPTVTADIKPLAQDTFLLRKRFLPRSGKLLGKCLFSA